MRRNSKRNEYSHRRFAVRDRNEEPELSEREARRLLAACPDEQLVAALQNVMSRFRPRGWMTIDQAAGLAEMSVRSLQRRLAAEGETFAQVCEQTRAELATRMLKCTDLSLGEIASELGYSERTNFIRAFKRWTGVTPEQFRTQSADTLDDDPVA